MKRYFPGGILKAELNFRNEGRTAYATLYYKSGKPAARGKYFDNKRDSTWIFYSFINGRIALKEDYRNGLKDGLSFRYYDDGTVAEKMMWKNGKENGIWEQYYENGNIRLTAAYKNGLREGKFESFSYSGYPSIKGWYTEGVMDGIWQYFKEETSPINSAVGESSPSNAEPGSLDFEVEYDHGRMLPNKEIDKRVDDFSKRVEESIKKYRGEEEKL